MNSNNDYIKFSRLALPIAIQYFLLVLLFISILSQNLVHGSKFAIAILILFVLYFLLKFFYLGTSNEILIFKKDHLIFKRNFLIFCIKELVINYNDVLTVKYDLAADGIRIKFWYIYTDDIWIKRYYSVKLKYREGKSERTIEFFSGPYDAIIQQKLHEKGYNNILSKPPKRRN